MRQVRVGPHWMPRAAQCRYSWDPRSTTLLGTRFTASNGAALALHRALARNIEGAI